MPLPFPIFPNTSKKWAAQSAHPFLVLTQILGIRGVFFLIIPSPLLTETGRVLQHFMSSKKTSWESYGYRTKTASLLWDWHKKDGCKDGKPLKIYLEMKNGTFPLPELNSQVKRNKPEEKHSATQQMHLLLCHRVSALRVMSWDIILLPCSPGIVAWL